MSDLLHPADVADLPDDPTHELHRPLPPRTWRDRLDDLVASVPAPTRLVGAVVALAMAAVVGWRLLAPPAPPPEMELPFAEQPAGPDDAGAPGDGETAATTAGVPGEAAAAGTGDVPGGGAGAEGQPPVGEGAAVEVVVHVAGAVAAPGVQRLPTGARVVDAVDAAGGALPDADLARINLAAPLTDGQQVYVLREGEVAPPVPAGPQAGGSAGTSGTGASGGLVDINRASADQLDELPGVGPTTAEAIIAHRDQHGPFGSVDELIDVRGIGEAKLEQLRDLVTV
jgi:competence protein ComEA